MSIGFLNLRCAFYLISSVFLCVNGRPIAYLEFDIFVFFFMITALLSWIGSFVLFLEIFLSLMPVSLVVGTRFGFSPFV